jgi:hypothetical protein
LLHRDWAIQENISTGKRATSVEDGNSTDRKDKAARTITALSTKELAKPELGPKKFGQSDTGRRNGPAEDRKTAGCEDKDPVNGRDTTRGKISALSTTEEWIRRNKSSKIPDLV